MKILFIGNSFHQKTKSHQFFLDILTDLGNVDVRWDDSFNPNPKTSAKLDDANTFDLVVVWQVYIPAIMLARCGIKNLVYVPMADSMWGDEPNAKYLLPHKILCFCEQQYNDIQPQGFNNIFYSRYFRKPSATPITDFSSIRPFMWQRRDYPNWKTALQLLGKTKYKSLTIKLHPDPTAGIERPNAIDCEDHRLTLANDWLSSYDFNAMLERHNLFFAPRTMEGIGMSFLDAMAMGIPVIAYDAPTMNEYIISGYSGHLYKGLPQAIEGLTTSTLKKWSQNTLSIVEAGYEQWMNDIERLKTWITS